MKLEQHQINTLARMLRQEIKRIQAASCSNPGFDAELEHLEGILAVLNSQTTIDELKRS